MKKTMIGILIYIVLTFSLHYLLLGNAVGDVLRIAIMIGACLFALFLLNKNEGHKNRYRIEFNLEKIDLKLQEKKDIYPNSSWNDILVSIIVLAVALINLFI